MTSRLLYELLLSLHAAAAVLSLVLYLRARARPVTAALLLRLPEVLLALTSVFFLFTFIYATNANMDYVQRFMSSHGNVLLAPNSTQERRSAYARFLPLLLVDAAAYVTARILARGARGARGASGAAREVRSARSASPGRAVFAAAASEPWPATWALALAAASGTLNGLAFPSFLVTGGLPVLGWFCLVPLLVCLEEVPLRRGIWYGTFAGVLQTMISNYWLGTFNLFSLQFVTVVTAAEYLPFMAAALLVLRRAGPLRFLVFPAAWTGFDWIRSMGFLGYPWGMLGTSQYPVTVLIQAASLTGVWGITFLLVLANSALASTARALVLRVRVPLAPLLTAAACLAVCGGWGVVSLHHDGSVSSPRTVRLALVQQDTDPRKDDYSATFDTLRRLTDRALAARPDLVVWSETAFVPNIRRWSTEDPKQYPLAALVRDFLSYQRGLGTWLLTGNDDYDLRVVDGVQERFDYNGSVLFSPRGERVETYHKMHLVPFTEYFPYKKQLPGIYALLMSFDAYLWEPGDRRVVFRHPAFRFATPICFEDAFPDDVRRFVAGGAEVILNISNDYWSLTRVEGMQHAANALFRAVENGRPLARAAASGLTCVIDSRGRILSRAPFYQEAFLVADVDLSRSRTTLYTRWGDWFPVAMSAGLVLLLAVGVAWRRSS